MSSQRQKLNLSIIPQVILTYCYGVELNLNIQWCAILMLSDVLIRLNTDYIY